ncbi:MAG: RNA polymerase sigma factor, partial [Tannerella sp.]|nr:RNA polymerase sigma factor [Tannerella sp.]
KENIFVLIICPENNNIPDINRKAEWNPDTANNRYMEIELFNTQLIALQSYLERFAMSLTSNRDDALDLVQETLLKALLYQDKYQQDTNLNAWVFKIMKNTFINNYRKAIKHETIINGNEYQLLVNNCIAQLTPESDYSQKELKQNINTLHPDLRIPFQMYADGYKYREIADHLNLNIGTVKSRIFLSRQKLMKILPDYHYRRLSVVATRYIHP